MWLQLQQKVILMRDKVFGAWGYYKMVEEHNVKLCGLHLCMYWTRHCDGGLLQPKFRDIVEA